MTKFTLDDIDRLRNVAPAIKMGDSESSFQLAIKIGIPPQADTEKILKKSNGDIKFKFTAQDNIGISIRDAGGNRMDDIMITRTELRNGKEEKYFLKITRNFDENNINLRLEPDFPKKFRLSFSSIINSKETDILSIKLDA